MGVFTLLSNYISTDAIIKKAANQSYREVVLIAGLMDGYFADAISYAQILAIDSKFQDNLTEYGNDSSVVKRTKVRSDVVQIVNTYMIARPIFSDISITDASFSPIYTGGVSAPKPEEVVKSIILDDSAAPILPQFSKLMTLTTRSGAQPGLALIKSVIDRDRGKRLGIITLYMMESNIAGIYSSKGTYNGEITIVDPEQNVISSTLKKNLFGKLVLGKEGVDYTADGSYFTTDDSGHRIIVSISTMEKTGWKIVNKIPLSEVTRELAKTTNLFLIILLTGLIIAVLSNLVISRAVLRPILKLTSIMENLYLSKTVDLRVDIHSNDEVGRLGKIFNKMMDQIKALITEKNLQQRFIRDYEVRLLQAQINPHFLYNSLETIIMLAQLDLKEQSIDAAKNLAGFYRLTLSHGFEYITVKEEINLTSSYLSIQKYRYIEYIDYSIDTQPDIMKFIVPKLTIQPIVENAIYHGLKPKNGGKIELSCVSSGEDLVFTIRDNGMGMEQEKIDELLNSESFHDIAGSFGLPSVNAKLKLLYGNAYGLAIDSRVGEYTAVTVRIPKSLEPPEVGGSI